MSYDAAAHAWAEHLRAGGTTPWDAGRWSLAADADRAARERAMALATGTGLIVLAVPGADELRVVGSAGTA